jgi:hypothetical protein
VRADTRLSVRGIFFAAKRSVSAQAGSSPFASHSFFSLHFSFERFLLCFSFASPSYSKNPSTAASIAAATVILFHLRRRRPSTPEPTRLPPHSSSGSFAEEFQDRRSPAPTKQTPSKSSIFVSPKSFPSIQLRRSLSFRFVYVSLSLSLFRRLRSTGICFCFVFFNLIPRLLLTASICVSVQTTVPSTPELQEF